MNSTRFEPTENFGFNFDNSYTQLPDSLFQKILPTKVKQPALAIFNSALAETLGLNADALIQKGTDYLAGNKIFSHASPIAQAYAGHQFGGFNVLGDGRAILLGEHISPHQQRVDVQLKGAGRTAYSRSGDGRAALGPMLREYIISEAMHALRIPTTRSLAVVYTGETVFRDDAYPGAVLTRIASSHIRVGTFQYAAAINDISALKALADYTIQRHFTHIATEKNPYAAMLADVINSQAKLIAQWMHIGFIHGVMNTDNMAISGETIDYGPCAFMEAYHPSTVFSFIDRQGRYAYANQPMEGQGADWTLTFRRLADAAEGNEGMLRPLFADPSALDAWLPRWRARLAPDAAAKLRAANPRIIPRNHKVEEALAAATDGDMAPFEALVAAITRPFDDDPALDPYALPAPQGFGRYVTFCGT